MQALHRNAIDLSRFAHIRLTGGYRHSVALQRRLTYEAHKGDIGFSCFHGEITLTTAHSYLSKVIQIPFSENT